MCAPLPHAEREPRVLCILPAVVKERGTISGFTATIHCFICPGPPDHRIRACITPVLSLDRYTTGILGNVHRNDRRGLLYPMAVHLRMSNRHIFPHCVHGWQFSHFVCWLFLPREADTHCMKRRQATYSHTTQPPLHCLASHFSNQSTSNIPTLNAMPALHPSHS